MKRSLMVALVLSLTLGIAGVANAALYTETQLLNRTLVGTGTTTWSHNVTPDFTVPFDTVNWAQLLVTGFAIGGAGNNDTITVEQTFNLGTLGGGWVIWDLSGVSQVFANGWGPGNGTFDVALAFNQGQGRYSSLNIISSTLAIDYTNIQGPNGTANGIAPVPEPGTLLLLGSGLVGLAGWGRKKFRK